MMTALVFQLNRALDRDALRATYGADGYVRIEGLLATSSLETLKSHIEARTDWIQVLNSRERVFELDRRTRAGFSDQRRRALDAAVYEGARESFQYRFENIRVPDDEEVRRAADDSLTEFAQWLSTGEALELLRHIVGDDSIAFVDAQATAYSPGDFLTGHDDAVMGKRRVAAYVFGLTPTWRIEWGGLLTFHDANGVGCRAFAPGLNSLDLFKVPLMHSVSLVSPAAAVRRLSVTGWLRSGRDSDG